MVNVLVHSIQMGNFLKDFRFVVTVSSAINRILLHKKTRNLLLFQNISYIHNAEYTFGTATAIMPTKEHRGESFSIRIIHFHSMLYIILFAAYTIQHRISVVSFPSCQPFARLMENYSFPISLLNPFAWHTVQESMQLLSMLNLLSSNMYTSVHTSILTATHKQ